MLSKEQAKALVAVDLARPPKYQYPGSTRDFAIMDAHTIDKDWGWVFFYNSQRYVETGDARHALFGNAPYIVNRHTAEVRVTGTSQPIEHYIAEYERELAGR